MQRKNAAGLALKRRRLCCSNSKGPFVSISCSKDDFDKTVDSDDDDDDDDVDDDVEDDDVNGNGNCNVEISLLTVEWILVKDFIWFGLLL